MIRSDGLKKKLAEIFFSWMANVEMTHLVIKKHVSLAYVVVHIPVKENLAIAYTSLTIL